MKVCDNASVGVLITNSAGELLVFERATAPIGIAPPAGHVYDDHEKLADGIRDEGASYRAAAHAEVSEEVGLTVTGLALLTSGWRINGCRRLPGSVGVGHDWRIYAATVTGDLNPSERETRNARWASRDELQELADRTVLYAWGVLTDAEFTAAPGIEPVWVRWLSEAGLVFVPEDGLEEIDRLLRTRAERGVTRGVTVRIDTRDSDGHLQTLWGEADDWGHLERLQDLTARKVDTTIPLHARLTPDGTDAPRVFQSLRTTFTEVEQTVSEPAPQ